jgi:WD40 repeat protein
MRILKGHRGQLRAVVYSPDGSKLATAGDDEQTKLWDVASGRELATIRQPGKGRQIVYALAFSPDGKLLATATEDVRVWDVNTLAEVPLPGRPRWGSGLAVAFTPDGSLLLITRTYSREGSTLVAWDRSAGTLCAPFGTQNAIASDLAVSASANLVAVALFGYQLGHRVGLWALDSKLERGILDHKSEALPSFQSIAISPDGRTLAVSGGPRVFVWDLPARRLRGRVEGHRNQVNDVAFAPSGALLATASHDGTVRFWDVESLRERAAFNWETGKVRAVAFSPDGMTAAAVGERRKVVVWDVE